MATGRTRLAIPLLLALAALAGCVQDDGTRFNPIRDITTVSDDDERQLGMEFDRELPKHVQLIYDPARISYERLLDIYWHHIDPLTPDAAFCDHGPQYRSIIFYGDPEQQKLAEASKQALDQSHRFRTPIVTAIQPATAFYPAEEYHQMFYKKNPARYEAYRIGCGRDERIRELWGDQAVSKGPGK